jgi:ketosteroid isomerase-like protein
MPDDHSTTTAIPPIVSRLRDAINAHELEAMVDCFTVDYRNETPVHPARDFVGREQVRKNWSGILGGIPDLRAEVVRCADTGDAVWAEWDWTGTRRDGARFSMRGVVIQGVAADGRAAWARFYMEPVDADERGVDHAVATVIGGEQ